jgi:hypothetical protein
LERQNPIDNSFFRNLKSQKKNKKIIRKSEEIEVTNMNNERMKRVILSGENRGYQWKR